MEKEQAKAQVSSKKIENKFNIKQNSRVVERRAPRASTIYSQYAKKQGLESNDSIQDPKSEKYSQMQSGESRRRQPAR